jgi:drug/metabolite transporter superfamily protein YnfA
MKSTIEKKTIIKVIGINLILFLLLLGLIYINKAIFRPTFNENYLSKILTGSFPNFIAAFLISLCAVNPVLIRKPRLGRLIVYLGTLLILTSLILDELESIGASRQYDVYDIIGSIIGALLAILTFEYLNYRQKRRKEF